MPYPFSGWDDDKYECDRDYMGSGRDALDYALEQKAEERSGGYYKKPQPENLFPTRSCLFQNKRNKFFYTLTEINKGVFNLFPVEDGGTSGELYGTMTEESFKLSVECGETIVISSTI